MVLLSEGPQKEPSRHIIARYRLAIFLLRSDMGPYRGISQWIEKVSASCYLTERQPVSWPYYTDRRRDRKTHVAFE
jgi:hypothetical protein